MNTLEKYLPIGTVILAKKGQKKLMIIGFCGVESEREDITYDYIGWLYPEGLLQSTDVFLFNHEQIEKIIYLGYDDDEEKKFKQNFSEYMLQYDTGEK